MKKGCQRAFQRSDHTYFFCLCFFFTANMNRFFVVVWRIIAHILDCFGASISKVLYQHVCVSHWSTIISKSIIWQFWNMHHLWTFAKIILVEYIPSIFMVWLLKFKFMLYISNILWILMGYFDLPTSSKHISICSLYFLNHFLPPFAHRRHGNQGPGADDVLGPWDVLGTGLRSSDNIPCIDPIWRFPKPWGYPQIIQVIRP